MDPNQRETRGLDQQVCVFCALQPVDDQEEAVLCFSKNMRHALVCIYMKSDSSCSRIMNLNEPKSFEEPFKKQVGISNMFKLVFSAQRFFRALN